MENKRMVMIPGPTPVVKSIQDQMGREVQAFGDPRFVADYKEVIHDLRTIVNCSGQVFCVAGTGTLAMEMAISNSTKRGDRVLLISHGFFGDRFIEICQNKERDLDVLKAEWGKIIPVSEIEEKLSTKKYAAVVVSHVDTATGVKAPIEEIGELMKKYPDTLYIVDGVAATMGEYTDFDGMNIDILFTASQKAFGVSPGLLMLWASKKAMDRREALGTISEYYCDFNKWLPIMLDPSKYFATPAVNLIWALKESIRIIKEEGPGARYERHLKNASAMQKALEALGFGLLAEAGHRAVTLSNIIYPEGINDADFRSTLMEEGIIVAGGLAAYAGKMFRIGHMGNIDINDEVAVLGVIERTLYKTAGIEKLGVGVAVYMKEMMK
ncbi:MAG: alanine--glyoxylate aminotransferase family protein [Peptostreptococcaceae bacterium]|nr:alanine--glyoxylate aminotransferase family protein [Peptostreptococcaceae bacterium]